MESGQDLRIRLQGCWLRLPLPRCHHAARARRAWRIAAPRSCQTSPSHLAFAPAIYMLRPLSRPPPYRSASSLTLSGVSPAAVALLRDWEEGSRNVAALPDCIALSLRRRFQIRHTDLVSSAPCKAQTSKPSAVAAGLRGPHRRRGSAAPGEDSRWIWEAPIAPICEMESKDGRCLDAAVPSTQTQRYGVPGRLSGNECMLGSARREAAISSGRSFY